MGSNPDENTLLDGSGSVSGMPADGSGSSQLPSGPSSAKHSATVVRAPMKATKALPKIEGHELIEELARGGMGVVFKARQLGLNRIVALKLIKPTLLAKPDVRKRFEQEVQSAALLNHPNFVMVFHTDLNAPIAYLSMEFVPGQDLSRIVAKVGGLPIDVAVNYTIQAAEALQHACEKGMVHRDIKPSNLMVSPSPLDASGAWIAGQKPGRLKILDMGLARVQKEDEAQAELTQVGSFLGTPDYIAPEQADDPRNADSRSDLYSLGCTLFFMLSGQVPYAGGTMVQKIKKHQSGPVPAIRTVRPEVPEALSVIMQRVMAKDPAHRFQTPGDLVDALRGYLANPGIVMGAGLPVGAGAAQPAPPDSGSSMVAKLLLGHGGEVASIGLSPDGRLLVSGGHDETIRLWDAQSGREIRQFSPNEGSNTAVAFSPNGQSIASSAMRLFNDDMGVHLWDPRTGREVSRLTGYNRNVTCLAFNPEGTLLATGCESTGTEKGRVRLWTLGDRLAHVDLGKHQGRVNRVMFIGTGRIFLTSGDDGTVRQWDSAKREAKGGISFQVGPILGLAYDKSRQLIAAGGAGLQVFEGSTKEMHNLAGNRVVVRSLVMLPKSQRLLAGCADGVLRAYSLASYNLHREWPGHQGAIHDVAVGRDESVAWTAGMDGSIRAWSLNS